MAALIHRLLIGVGFRDASLEARDGIPSPGFVIGIASLAVRDASSEG